MLNVYIGWDSREVQAFHVLVHSLMRHTAEPVAIYPLYRPALIASGLYWREPDVLASTEFSLTRFLVPFLSNYEGRSLFLDCDMLCQGDIAEVFAHAEMDPFKACFVVQHDYVPKTATKMDGQVQSVYPRKNWSSVMLFQNSLCHRLTPEYVNTASPAELHRFHWLHDRHLGALPVEWNHLVGEYEPNPNAKLLHYTLGGPWFPGYDHGPEAARWVEARDGIFMTATAGV